MKGLYQLDQRIEEVGEHNCFISEITVAELKYGVANSKTIDAMRSIVESFISKFSVVPIYNSLNVYASEKANLRKMGLMIDDFDILIGATAITNNMVVVTKNVSHLGRLKDIVIEDWTAAKV